MEAAVVVSYTILRYELNLYQKEMYISGELHSDKYTISQAFPSTSTSQAQDSTVKLSPKQALPICAGQQLQPRLPQIFPPQIPHLRLLWFLQEALVH